MLPYVYNIKVKMTVQQLHWNVYLVLVLQGRDGEASGETGSEKPVLNSYYQNI